MLATEVLHLTHPLLHSKNPGSDPKIPALSESSSVILNECSFQGISFTRGNKSRSFYISGFFLFLMWEVSSISHIWHTVQLVLLPERTCKCRPQALERNISSFAKNCCQSQWMIDQNWDLDSDHPCSYKMLKGFLPFYQRRWQLFGLGIIQFPFPVNNIHFAALLWLELSPTMHKAFS